MREVTPLIKLLEGLSIVCSVITTPPFVTCNVFDDVQSCIEVAKSKKPPARTKQIAIKYYHFRSLVDNKIIKIIMLMQRSSQQTY